MRQLISDLQYLNKSIKYCMLKDYISEGDYADIDILISSRDRRMLKKILQRLGYNTYQTYHRAVFYHKVIKGEIVRLHIHFNYFFDFLKADEVLQRRYMKKGIPLLSSSDYVATLAHKIKKGRSASKYIRELKKAKKFVDKTVLYSSLSKAFEENSINIKKIMNKQFAGLKFKKSHQRFEKFRKFLDTPSIMTIALKQLVRPSPYIVFVGVDGSGKTTTVGTLIDYLKRRKFRIYGIYGGRFRFRFLPLNWLTKRVAKAKIKKGAPRDVIHYKSPFVHTLTPIAYYLEYFLAYIFIICRKRRTNNFAISERGFIDVIVSPNTKDSIAAFFNKLLPRPTKTIYLYNDLEVLARRRKDHPKEDLERQLKKYKEHEHLFTHKIKTTDRKKTMEKVITILFEK